ncbi:cytochrome B5 [Clostridium sp. P21]|uniref:Cytochrome B5 n=1 Tax=Clostridium muellerianum TaxID=2716538 RepID=A0A7Y0HNB2_9CLOT|nr:cytochrome b5 domain-containing protein [Clostridium muellerianum]NMM63839.1 cytochrome B5 [Clostridium muellerianum]
MDKNNLNQLQGMLQEINHYKKMIKATSCPYKKMHFINKIAYKVTKILDSMNVEKIMNREEAQPLRKFTIEELSKYDGSMGKPAYVAVNGVVYDVSRSSVWGGGTHFGLYAGKDLSEEFKGCHGDKIEILKSLPVVGNIK